MEQQQKTPKKVANVFDGGPVRQKKQKEKDLLNAPRFVAHRIPVTAAAAAVKGGGITYSATHPGSLARVESTVSGCTAFSAVCDAPGTTAAASPTPTPATDTDTSTANFGAAATSAADSAATTATAAATTASSTGGGGADATTAAAAASAATLVIAEAVWTAAIAAVAVSV